MADLPFTPDEAASRAIDGTLRLEGEDVETTDLEDAVHWVSVYSELLAFKQSLLNVTDSIVEGMRETAAQTDAMTDVVLLRTQADRYRRRLQEWTARVEQLSA